jgi:adenosylcobinamide-GDP ribazoletransferase
MTNFLIAIGFLTKIPTLKKLPINDKNLANSMAYFPLVGLLLGLILVLANNIMTPFLPERVVNLILIFFLTLLTGGLHLDGLADTVDGFCARTKSKEEILTIMKDSRIGAMGVIAVALSIFFKYELLNSVPMQFRAVSLILMCSLSRWTQVMASHFSKYARENAGLGKAFVGNIGKRYFYTATLFTILILFFVWFPKGLLIFLITYISSWLLMRFIHERIGGMTGDTIGAISEVSEVIILLCICVLTITRQ